MGLGLGDLDRRTVGGRDAERDRQAKPGTTVATAARLVEPDESLEHTFTILGRDAGAVIVDRQHHLVCEIVERHPDPTARMADGVRQKVSNETREL